MSDVIIVDCLTGNRIERAYTPDEIKQRKADEKAAKKQQAEEKRQAKARAAALEHAKSLGFTDEMIAVMYPGLAEDSTE